MMPPAPGRLSTINCWLNACESFCATMRPTMSVPPPGAIGITMRTGFAGYSDCAYAQHTVTAPDIAIAAAPRVEMVERRAPIVSRLRPRPERPIRREDFLGDLAVHH